MNEQARRTLFPRRLRACLTRQNSGTAVCKGDCGNGVGPFWQFILSAGIDIAEVTLAELPRMRSLMEQYADLPMDFADASLVALSERLKLRRVFTLDRRDFLVYRPGTSARSKSFPEGDRLT